MAAAAAALLAAASPGAAAAPPVPVPVSVPVPGPVPGPGLVLTAAARSATLSCDQVPQGTHPLPLPACIALSAADGDFDALPGMPGVCREPYAPITVTARGEYRGRHVDWRKKFANPCILRTATGLVFAL
jgi:hypothetical protein